MTTREAASQVITLLEEAGLLCIKHNLSRVGDEKYATVTSKIIQAKRHAERVRDRLEPQ